MHILLTNVHLDCRGKGSGNRNVGRVESVETGDESVEAGEKHNNHVIIRYIFCGILGKTSWWSVTPSGVRAA